MTATYHDAELLDSVREAQGKAERRRVQGPGKSKGPWVNDQQRAALTPTQFTGPLPSHLAYCDEGCGAVILIGSVSRSTCLACKSWRKHTGRPRPREAQRP